MDDRQLDALARALAVSRSRRTALKTLVGAAGAGIIALVGFGTNASTARGRPRIVGRPRVTFDGASAVVTWTTDQPADGAVEFGPTSRMGETVAAEGIGLEHQATLTDLEPGKQYHYRVRSTNENGTATSARARFKAPPCPSGTGFCGGTCIADCPAGWQLDPASCACICGDGTVACGDTCLDVSRDPNNCGDCGIVCALANATADCLDGTCVIGACADGFGDCDGDPTNGCETPLGSIEHCRACGDACDDGNACTEDVCDPVEGCVANNLPDGTACGTAGTCQAGACLECEAGGTCKADRDCCDDEACCNGVCTARASFDDDPGNCGTCGTVCPAGACQQATCAGGSCDTVPVSDHEACDTDNPCAAAGHCMDGTCMGSPSENGTPCDEAKICIDGTCVEASQEPTITAAADTVLFGDDFETGDLSRWTSKSRVTVQSTEVAAGTYAARATASGSASYATKKLSAAQPEIYYRTRFKLISQGTSAFYLLYALTSSGSRRLGVQIKSTGELGIYNAYRKATIWSATKVTKGTWHELQVRVKVAGSSSQTELWYDGTRLADLSKTLNLGTSGIGRVQFGDTSSRTFDVAIDDLSVCAGTCPPPPPLTTTPTPDPDPSGAAGSDTRRLLASYNFHTDSTPYYGAAVYRPLQFDAGLTIADPILGNQQVTAPGDYAGWDVLTTLNYGEERIKTNADWLEMKLNRPATLAVVWRDGPTVPAWLNTWTKAGTVTVSGQTMPTFRRSYPAGRVLLPGVYDQGATISVGRDTYWVLFAEQDGKRSAPPPVPSGLEAPRPNQTCPSWVHDRYVATGPDGKSYPTWHNQIDPVYWCYFRHEHGSNPAHFGSDYKSALGYTAAAHGMSEAHVGFKNMVFDDHGGIRWLVMLHFGTGGLGRVCNRFHTLDVAARSIATGELLADLHLMGDYGPSVVNATKQAFRPTSCPDQAAQASGSYGVRQLPTQDTGAIGYEPWRLGVEATILGLRNSLLVNNTDPQVICDTITCDQAVSTGDSGSTRFIEGNGFSIVAGTKNSGVFYTDALGQRFLASGDAGAVRQYIKPGLNLSLTLNSKCHDVNAWGQPFVCDPSISRAGPTNREGSLQVPN